MLKDAIASCWLRKQAVVRITVHGVTMLGCCCDECTTLLFFRRCWSVHLHTDAYNCSVHVFYPPKSVHFTVSTCAFNNGSSVPITDHRLELCSHMALSCKRLQFVQVQQEVRSAAALTCHDSTKHRNNIVGLNPSRWTQAAQLKHFCFVKFPVTVASLSHAHHSTSALISAGFALLVLFRHTSTAVQQGSRRQGKPQNPG